MFSTMPFCTIPFLLIVLYTLVHSTLCTSLCSLVNPHKFTLHPTLFIIFGAPYFVYKLYNIWSTLLCLLYLVHPTLFYIFGAPYSVYYIVKARIMNCLIARIENMKTFLMWYSCIPLPLLSSPPSLSSLPLYLSLQTRHKEKVKFM